MSRFEERDRFVFTLVAIAASIFLFACGGAESTGNGETLAERVRAARKGRGMPATASVTEMPAHVAQPEPGQTPGAPSLRQAEVTPTARMEPGIPDGPGPASEPSARPAPPLRDSAGGHVFSNKDLERYRRTKEDFGFRDGAVVVDVTKKPAEGADGGEESSAGRGMARAERDAELVSTQARIRELMQEQEYLKKRMLPLANPFVARPTVSEGDKLAESGMDNAERLQRVKERIAVVDSELDLLQRRFAELQSMKPSGIHGEAPDSGTPDEE